MKWETRCDPPFFLSSMAQRSLICASFQINVMHRSESNFEENLGIKDILIHQKTSHLKKIFLFTYATSVNVWDNITMMLSSEQSDWSEISE